ncbi:MAG: T9SS type A sorting domain-containing protein [Chitinophagales bacterium]|nr:T9SS type A sorting domain-containing protein [Chitinophagales bacterium]
MKKTFTIFLVSLVPFFVFADQGGPDQWGYTWKDSNEPDGPVYNWIDIESEFGIEVKLLQDDNIRGPFQMNFDFPYYWYTVNEFYVGSNGYISFQYGNLASPFPFSPSTTPPNDLIGAFVNDLTFAGTNDSAACYYWVNGAKDTLIVSYINVPYFDTNVDGQSGNNTFQIILSAVDSSITFQYKDVTPVSPYSGASAVGIENYSGDIGLFYNTFTYQSPPANSAIKFYPPTNPTLEVTDAFVVYNDNPETGAIFLVGNSGTPHNLTTLVKNGGNIPTGQFNVQATLNDPMGNQVVNEFVLIDSLQPSETQLITFAQQLNPTVIGTYKFTANTQLPGDDVNSNNNKNQEIITVDTTQSEILLSYNDDENSIFSVNWVGDQGGVGTYFIPPFYPVTLTKIHYWIASNYSFAGMSGRVFDDDGVNGLPFTMYDSVYLSPNDINVGTWTDIELPNPVVITSGGFYVSWDMQGTGITLGNTGNPVSNRSFEVFDNGWGVYRYRPDYDPMITATIVAAGFPTELTNLPVNTLQLGVYPNPANDITSISYSSPSTESVWFIVSDIQGKVLQRINLSQGKTAMKQFTLNTEKYSPGIYLIELMCGKSKKIEKLLIQE